MTNEHRITLGAMVYPDWPICPFEAQMAALRECGLDQTEIFMSEKALDSAPDVAEKLRKAGIMPISLHAPFNREISLSTLNPLRRLASVEKGLAAIQAAGVAGVDTIVFHPADDVRNIPLRGEHAAALIDSMRRLCAAAEAKSIRVALENMPSGELGASLIEIADLVRASGIHNLGVCLDTGHANMNKDLIAGVVASSQRLFALHVHDNDGLKDQHLAVFAGTVNWDEFVKTLRDIRFSGCFMLETGQIFPTKEIPKPPLVWIERVRQLLAERPEG